MTTEDLTDLTDTVWDCPRGEWIGTWTVDSPCGHPAHDDRWLLTDGVGDGNWQHGVRGDLIRSWTRMDAPAAIQPAPEEQPEQNDLSGEDLTGTYRDADGDIRLVVGRATDGCWLVDHPDYYTPNHTPAANVALWTRIDDEPAVGVSVEGGEAVKPAASAFPASDAWTPPVEAGLTMRWRDRALIERLVKHGKRDRRRIRKLVNLVNDLDLALGDVIPRLTTVESRVDRLETSPTTPNARAMCLHDETGLGKVFCTRPIGHDDPMKSPNVGGPTFTEVVHTDGSHVWLAPMQAASRG